jgi:hypothetical protein
MKGSISVVLITARIISFANNCTWICCSYYVIYVVFSPVICVRFVSVTFFGLGNRYFPSILQYFLTIMMS